MTGLLPGSLARLLAADTPAAQDSAWEEFVREHSPLLLTVCRAMGGPEDAAMDRYAFVLERLRHDGCRKLGAYTVDARASFGTWLALVARNLCRDHHRQRYGRLQSDTPEAATVHAARRSLADLVAVDLETLPVADDSMPAELRVRTLELRGALESALAGLDTHDRLLVRMRYEDDLSVPEIARITGYRNAFMVYRKLEGILGRLQAALRAAGVEDAVP